MKAVSSQPRLPVYPLSTNIDDIKVRGDCFRAKEFPMDSWAKTFLYTFYNGARSKIAKGEKVLGGRYNDTTPRLMTGMLYNCYFDFVAHRLIGHIRRKHWNHLYAMNYYESPIKNLSRWRLKVGSATKFWLRNSSSWQPILYPHSPFMGCAAQFEKRDSNGMVFKLVCVFDQIRNPWQPLYPKPTGSPCKGNGDCRTFGPNYKCEAKLGLCFASFDKNYWIA